MPLYTVLAPPALAEDMDPDPLGTVFVKDGFCWPCLFFPLTIVWLLYRKLWLGLLVYLAVSAAIFIAARTMGGPVPGLVALFWLFFFALQANAFRRWTLIRHGYDFVGVAEGRRVGDAEIRYFHEMENPHRDPRLPPPSRLTAAMRPPRGPSAESGDVVGLFPLAGPGVVTIAIIDYGAGNLRSAEKAFEHAIAARASSETIAITTDPDVVARADRVVLPGDGAFADCKRNLAAIDGMLEAIDEATHRRAVPFLGICVGMQLLATRGIEHAVTDGLDIVKGEVRPITPDDPALKVPHMGWNTLSTNAPHRLLDGIRLGPEGWHAFFLHGFHLVPEDGRDVVAAADYGGPVTAIVARGNVAGTQFHPEKSQRLGLKLIENFLAWSP